LYEEVATVVVATDARTPEEVTRAVLESTGGGGGAGTTRRGTRA
ncbi:shikimate kinase, partial [Streptomyces viridiviolaceus]